MSETKCRELPKKDEIYRHFKGNQYRIVAIALKEDTMEELVIYEALYGNHTIYARNADVFLSEIDRNKYPDAAGKWRFEKIGSSASEDEEPEGNASGLSEDDKMAFLMNRYLDTRSSGDRLDILRLMEHSITNPMIDTLAAASDVDIKDGTIEQRVRDLKDCLKMIDRYESGRR